MEEWKHVPDFYDFQISNFGNIKSNRSGEWKNIKPTLHHSGYFMITLRNDNKQLSKFIHRLVGLLFIENPDNKPSIDHIDRNKLNNSISNLRWATYTEQRINTKLRLSSTNQRCICETNDGTYRVGICRNYKFVYRKTFKTLKDAIEARDNYLKYNSN